MHHNGVLDSKPNVQVKGVLPNTSTAEQIVVQVVVILYFEMLLFSIIDRGPAKFRY